MIEVDPLFREYEAFHKNPTNKLCHYVGISTIVLSIFGLLARVTLAPTTPVGPLDLALPVALAAALFYFVLDRPLGLGSLVILGSFAFAGRFLDWRVSLGLFVLGWILQFVGHYLEGKRPAFFRNGVHLLVGPLWILSHLYESVGLRAKRNAAPSA